MASLKKKIELEKRLSSLVRVLSSKKIDVVFRGKAPHVEWDPKTLEPVRVCLVAIPDDPSDSFIETIEGFLDHEGAHLLYTDATVVKEAHDRKIAQLHNLFEDIYIERRISQELPGTAKNLQRMRNIFASDFIEPLYKKMMEHPSAHSLRDWWNILCVVSLRALAGHKPLDKYMEDKWDRIKPIIDALEPVLKNINSPENSAECLDLALQARRIINRVLIEDEKATREPAKDSEEKSSEPSEDERPKERKETPPAESEELLHSPSEESDEESDEESGESRHSDEKDERELEPTSKEDDCEAPEPTAEESESNGEDGQERDFEEGEAEASDRDSTDDADESTQDAPEDGEGRASGDEEGSESDEKGGAAEEGAEGESDSHQDNGGDDDDGEKSESPESELTDEELEQEIEAVDYDEAAEAMVAKESELAQLSGSYMPYTTEFDRIEPAPIVSFKGKEVSSMAEIANQMAGEGRRHLVRIVKGRSDSAFQRGVRRGRVDTSNLHRLTVGDDRLFKKKAVLEKKSIAVQLVVDCSGSMSGGFGCGVKWAEKTPELTDRFSKIELAAISAWIFAQTLDLLNIPCEVIGFTTDYEERMRVYDWDKIRSANPGFGRYDPLYLPIFKGFDERFGPTQKARLASAAITEDGFLCENIDGESLRIAAARLMERKEDKKLMIVFSDGRPSGGFSSSRVICDDLEKATAQIEKEGINLVGVGIMSSAVKTFYRKHVVLNSADELPRQTIRQISEAILA